MRKESPVSQRLFQFLIKFTGFRQRHIFPFIMIKSSYFSFHFTIPLHSTFTTSPTNANCLIKPWTSRAGAYVYECTHLAQGSSGAHGLFKHFCRWPVLICAKEWALGKNILFCCCVSSNLYSSTAKQRVAGYLRF